ncbi:MAG: hypothetical protein ACI90V_006071, partial [Bacillariaceae sp.]
MSFKIKQEKEQKNKDNAHVERKKLKKMCVLTDSL